MAGGHCGPPVCQCESGPYGLHGDVRAQKVRHQTPPRCTIPPAEEGVPRGARRLAPPQFSLNTSAHCLNRRLGWQSAALIPAPAKSSTPRPAGFVGGWLLHPQSPPPAHGRVARCDCAAFPPPTPPPPGPSWCSPPPPSPPVLVAGEHWRLSCGLAGQAGVCPPRPHPSPSNLLTHPLRFPPPAACVGGGPPRPRVLFPTPPSALSSSIPPSPYFTFPFAHFIPWPFPSIGHPSSLPAYLYSSPPPLSPTPPLPPAPSP